MSPANEGDSFDGILESLISASIYFFLMICGGANVIFLLLGCTAFSETMQTLSYTLIPATNSTGHLRKCRSFQECMKLHRILQILIRTGNHATSQFLQTLIVMGVLLATCGGFVFITMYSRLPFLFIWLHSWLFRSS